MARRGDAGVHDARAASQVPARRLAGGFIRNTLRLPPRSGHEPELPPGIDTLATLLGHSGYHVALKGKWHLCKPVQGESWSAADPPRVERDYGFREWEPPDAGGDTKAEHFGGGNVGASGLGWDEDYTRQAEAWLGRPRTAGTVLPCRLAREPARRARLPGLVSARWIPTEDFRDLGVPLPATLDEDLGEKPDVQALSRIGMDSYLGPLVDRHAQQDYVNFYAYLHRVVDEKIGRVLTRARRSRRSCLAAFSHRDRAHLRSRRDGPRARWAAAEGLQRLRGDDARAVRRLPSAHVRSASRERRARLAARRPTDMPSLAGPSDRPESLDGADLGPLLRGESTSVRDAVLFTYDDHQAGTALQDASGQPNRIRCVRDERFKYAVYLDPAGRAAPNTSYTT